MATGRQQVFATLRYLDAPAAIEWLKAALGFLEHEIHTNEDGTIAHAELAFGNDLVMLGSTEAPTDSATVYLAHADVDAHYARALAAGAERTELVATVLGSPDPQSLADFYRQLLGWQITSSSPEWVRLVGPEGGASLSFQFESDYVRPVWPQVEGEQQMMMHLDIGVEELDSGVAFAESLGATLADYQPQEDVRVMLDPVGHPFCLFA